MQQWLTLFLQYALPVLKTLASQRTRQSIVHFPQELANSLVETQEMLTFLGLVERQEGKSAAEVELDWLVPQNIAVQSFIQSVYWSLQNRTSDFHQWRWQQEKELQQRLAVQHRELFHKLAAVQRQTALQLPEVHKILDCWPLKVFPSQLLETRVEDPIPLRIFLAPPKLQFDLVAGDVACCIPDTELSLAQRLREFLSQAYSLHDSVRPTEFLGGAWESKRFHGEASIKALFHLLKSEPTLILESELDGDVLNFRMAYWGLGQDCYTYLSLFKIPFREFLDASAKARAQQWKAARHHLLSLGYPLEEITALGGENESNLALLEKIHALEAAGFNSLDLPFHYQATQQDWQQLMQFLGVCHCLVAGWMADMHHLIHSGVAPIFPRYFPQLMEELSFEPNSNGPDWLTALLETTAAFYEEICSGLNRAGLVTPPELILGLAQSFAHLPDTTLAHRYVEASLQSWLAQRLKELTPEKDLLAALQPILMPEDRPYLEALAVCFRSLKSPQAAQVDSLLKALDDQLTRPRSLLLVPAQTIQIDAGKILAIAMVSQHCQFFAHCESGQIERGYLPMTGVAADAISHPPLTLKSHQGKVFGLVVSVDGQTLVSCDLTPDRCYIKVWDGSTGRLRHRLSGHRRPIHALSLSPDSTWLASGSHKIKLWNLETGEPFRTLFGHRHWVSSLAISPDGQTLVSGSEDTTVKLWHGPTGELRHTLRGHKGTVRSLIFSPDGQWIVSGSEDHTVKLWDLKTGKLRHTLKTHQGAVRALAMSQDGNYLVSGGADKTLRIWNFQTGELLQTLNGHTGIVRAIALRQDSQILASACDQGSLKIWQVS